MLILDTLSPSKETLRFAEVQGTLNIIVLTGRNGSLRQGGEGLTRASNPGKKTQKSDNFTNGNISHNTSALSSTYVT